MQWSVLIFSTTNYTNADQVRGPHCIRIIRKIRASTNRIVPSGSLSAKFERFERFVLKKLVIERPPEYLFEMLKSNFFRSKNFNVFYNLEPEKFSESPLRAPT